MFASNKTRTLNLEGNIPPRQNFYHLIQPVRCDKGNTPTETNYQELVSYKLLTIQKDITFIKMEGKKKTKKWIYVKRK